MSDKAETILDRIVAALPPRGDRSTADVFAHVVIRRLPLRDFDGAIAAGFHAASYDRARWGWLPAALISLRLGAAAERTEP